ncbi:MAG: hypothetical protein ABR608_08965 [Pseudonocardiaceae bacterium]
MINPVAPDEPVITNREELGRVFGEWFATAPAEQTDEAVQAIVDRIRRRQDQRDR